MIKKYFSSFSFFYTRLGYRIYIRIILSLGIGLMDGFGLAMFLPLLQMADPAQQAEHSLGNLEFLIDLLHQIGVSITLPNILLVICSFFLLKGMAMLINSFYEVSVRQLFILRIRLILTKLFTRLAYKSFVNSDSGKIQNTLSGEVNKMSQAYAHYFNTIQQFVLVLIYMSFAFFVNSQFAILISIGGIVTNFLFRTIYKRTKQASRRLTSGNNQYQGLIIQYVANFKYLKASGALSKFNTKLIKTIHELEHNNKRIGKLSGIVIATREPLLILVVCTVIYLEVTLWNGTLSAILVSLLFFYRALSALVQMQSYYNNFLSVSGSMENMTNFQEYLETNVEADGSIEFTHFKDGIKLEHTCFNYGDRKIIHDISLIIKKNQTVAFVGESGSGKTTLVNLIAGLMPLDSGNIFIDDISINDLNKESYQQRIGYITQEPVIFNDTIFNNVTFWAEPSEENKMRFYAALEKAAIADFVDALPEKESTMLGNSGINLSGGQRQRFSIARELFKDIDILVLDEATSALDSETEKSIQENIDKLKGKYTLIIVAHRLSTIRNADMIVLMDNGTIEQIGTFEELYDSSSRFKRMVNLQEV